jgi:nucleotide-binding universal stress UspA family protein
MSYKEIMVHIDASQLYLNRLDLAVQLAKEHEAHLTGLCAITHQYYQPEQDSAKHRIDEAEELFRLKTSQAGVRADWLCADWHVAGVDMTEIVNYYGHFKDLIVVGQALRDGSVPQDLPERVVLGSGRPVLVVPYVGSFSSAGKRLILAWKPGRASARAVNDALPFLLKAQEVCLLEIRFATEPESMEISPREDIATYLRAHGINVRKENLVTGTIPVANIIMNYAWENGCDMAVMGAYSSSGLGTGKLGVVADQMLDHMTLPVLMAN